MLAVAAAGLGAAESHAQTVEGSYFDLSGNRSVEEGGTVTITVTPKTSTTRYIRYWTAPMTKWGRGSPQYAEEGVDYYTVGPKTLALFPGRSETITLRTAEDNGVEHNEYFTLRYSGEADNGGTYSGYLTIEILNDDQATITVSDARAVEGDALEFTATLNTWLHPGSINVIPAFTGPPAAPTTPPTPTR